MKYSFPKTLVLPLACLCIGSVCAFSRTIISPDFECRKGSTLTVEEIDLGEKETKVRFHAVYRPHSWISLDSADCLSDPATGRKYYPRRAEGINLKERFYMPESGHHDFTVFYDPMPENTTAIDFAPGTSWTTFNIDLTGRRKTDKGSSEKIIADKKRYTPKAGFFRTGNCRIYGKITGYNPKTEFESFSIYYSDMPVGKYQTLSVAVKPDGTFDETLTLTSPQTVYLTIPSLRQVYIEPGNDLQITFDWEDYMDAARMCGLVNRVDNLSFGGTLGDINTSIYLAPEEPQISGFNIPDDMDVMVAKDSISSAYDKWGDEIERYITSQKPSPTASRLLRDGVIAGKAMTLFDLVMERQFKKRPAPADSLGNADIFPTPLEYYEDFVPELLSRDSTFLASPQMYFLLNRLGFSPLRFQLGFSNHSTDDTEVQSEIRTARLISEFAGQQNTPLLWQMAYCAKSLGNLEKSSLKNRQEIVTAVADSIDMIPYLRSRIDLTFDELMNEDSSILYETEGGRLLKEIIDPFKGKIVIVDFWSTGCGPCRSAIEHSLDFRKKHRGNPDFIYIFITDEESSPKRAYDKYTAANLEGEVLAYLDTTRKNKIYPTFDITGFPRYMVFDREGNFYDRKYSGHNIVELLKELGVEIEE